MVSVYVPGGVEVEVATFMVEVPELVIELGVNVAVAPVGNPVTDMASVALKPLSAVTVAV
jgi:hypothetical protein